MLFEIKWDKEALKTLRLIEEWPRRLEHLIPMIPYLGADYVRRFVAAKLPKTKDLRAYRSSLEVAMVKGLRSGQSAYTVQLDMKNRLIAKSKVKPNATILEVHPTRRMKRANAAVKVLEKHNPWTVASLPFKPDPRLAVVRTRKATPKEVAAITTKRLRERSKWSAELVRAGARNARKSKSFNTPKNMQTLPGVALDALRLEFGLGGTRPRPAWRLALSQFARNGIMAIAKDKRFFVLPLTKLSFNMWQKWPVRTRHSISSAQAAKYIAFQKRLGIKGR